MGWMPGCPADPGVYHGALSPVAVVLHRTYGAWGGDYSVGKQGIFQFLIGKDDGNWVQFAPTEIVQWHCNGANFKAVGIELEGTNEDPLTAWQAARLGDVLRYCSQTHGIPLNYLAPDAVPYASVWVNGGGFSGVISHCSVATDDGSQQHTDRIEVADWVRAVSGVDVALDDTDIQKIAAAVGGQQSAYWGKYTNIGDLWNHVDKVAAALGAKIDKVTVSGGGTGGVTADQVRAIFREELNKTTLGG